MNQVACLSFYPLKAVLIPVLLAPDLKHPGEVPGSRCPMCVVLNVHFSFLCCHSMQFLSGNLIFSLSFTQLWTFCPLRQLVWAYQTQSKADISQPIALAGLWLGDTLRGSMQLPGRAVACLPLPLWWAFCTMLNPHSVSLSRVLIPTNGIPFLSFRYISTAGCVALQLCWRMTSSPGEHAFWPGLAQLLCKFSLRQTSVKSADPGFPPKLYTIKLRALLAIC